MPVYRLHRLHFSLPKKGGSIYNSHFANACALLSFILLGEKLSAQYFIALTIMIAGIVFLIFDTLSHAHCHQHEHVFTHTHDGTTHTHRIIHSHEHTHLIWNKNHWHFHSKKDLEKESKHG